MHVVIYYR